MVPADSDLATIRHPRHALPPTRSSLLVTDLPSLCPRSRAPRVLSPLLLLEPPPSLTPYPRPAPTPPLTQTSLNCPSLSLRFHLLFPSTSLSSCPCLTPFFSFPLLVPVSRPLYPVVGGEGSGNWDPLRYLDHYSPAGWDKDKRSRELDHFRVPARVPNRVPSRVPMRHGTPVGTRRPGAYRVPNAPLTLGGRMSHAAPAGHRTSTSPVTFHRQYPRGRLCVPGRPNATVRYVTSDIDVTVSPVTCTLSDHGLLGA
jgi:hypothetical protein